MNSVKQLPQVVDRFGEGEQKRMLPVKLCLSLVVVASSAFGQHPGFGKCPNPPVQQDFQLEKVGYFFLP